MYKRFSYILYSEAAMRLTQIGRDPSVLHFPSGAGTSDNEESGGESETVEDESEAATSSQRAERRVAFQ